MTASVDLLVVEDDVEGFAVLGLLLLSFPFPLLEDKPGGLLIIFTSPGLASPLPPSSPDFTTFLTRIIFLTILVLGLVVVGGSPLTCSAEPSPDPCPLLPALLDFLPLGPGALSSRLGLGLSMLLVESFLSEVDVDSGLFFLSSPPAQLPPPDEEAGFVDVSVFVGNGFPNRALFSS